MPYTVRVSHRQPVSVRQSVSVTDSPCPSQTDCVHHQTVHVCVRDKQSLSVAYSLCINMRYIA